MMRQKPTARALKANCSLLCIAKSDPTKTLQQEGGGLVGHWFCQSPTTAGFVTSVTVCPQLPNTEPSSQVLEKMNEEKSPALVANKSPNHHPQMEKDEGPSGPRVSKGKCDFPRR